MTFQISTHDSWKQWLRVSRAAARYTLAGALAFSPLGVTSLAHALDAPHVVPAATRPATDTTRAELKRFERYLRTHPTVARQLRKDPSRVNNPEFLAKHVSLEKFLAAHPAVREELKEHPDAFKHHQKRVDRHQHHDKLEQKS